MEQSTSVNIEDSCCDTIYLFLFFGDVEIGDVLQITHCLLVELKTTILSPLSCMCILVPSHGLCRPSDSRESEAHWTRVQMLFTENAFSDGH